MSRIFTKLKREREVCIEDKRRPSDSNRSPFHFRPISGSLFLLSPLPNIFLCLLSRIHTRNVPPGGIRIRTNPSRRLEKRERYRF